jgi:hypothetical protein
MLGRKFSSPMIIYLVGSRIYICLELSMYHSAKAHLGPEPDADRHEETPVGVLPNPLHEPGTFGPKISLRQILMHLCEIKHVRL